MWYSRSILVYIIVHHLMLFIHLQNVLYIQFKMMMHILHIHI
jgi:hypothetical protein